jgi:hypothetical protein
MLPHSLPKNWRREERLREGIGRKLVQIIYWSPEGKKITTKKELMKELGSDWDAPECLDFKTGVYSSEALKKKQEKEKKKNEYFLKHGHRPIEYNFELPIRRAQWCGDMPLNVVRNFPSNEVRSEYPKQKSPSENSEEKEIRPIPPVRTRPNQLLSEKRLEHLRPKNEFNRDVGQLSLPECIKPTTEEVFGENPLITRICGQLLNSKVPMNGQKKDEDKNNSEEKNAYRDIMTQDPVQPLCNQVQISDSQILEQEAKVTKAQQALARAMALFEQQQSSVPIEHLSNGNSIELMS